MSLRPSQPHLLRPRPPLLLLLHLTLPPHLALPPLHQRRQRLLRRALPLLLRPRVHHLPHYLSPTPWHSPGKMSNALPYSALLLLRQQRSLRHPACAAQVQCRWLMSFTLGLPVEAQRCRHMERILHRRHQPLQPPAQLLQLSTQVACSASTPPGVTTNAQETIWNTWVMSTSLSAM